MSKTYQNDASTAIDIAVPEAVTVSMAEIADDLREGLLAFAVGAGLQVMGALMDADVTGLVGPRGRHDRDRLAVRHGTGRGSVTLGGRRVPVTRPRVRASDGSGEVPVPSYELFNGTEVLGRMAMERMLAGLSTRRYGHGLEPVGLAVEQNATGTSKSAVSRRFVAMTETALGELLTADLSGLDLVAIMVDGVHFAEHCCVVALGIGVDGTKHPLAVVEGSTENTTLVTRPDRRAARTWPRRHPPDPRRAGRVEGAAPSGARRVRPPGDRPLPAPQGPQRQRSSPATATTGGRTPHA